MKPMTQRAGKPNRILCSGYPSEGVKALWAFHNGDSNTTSSSVAYFFLTVTGIRLHTALNAGGVLI
jgi:hypothetical protein